ncbi:MAG: bifunctional serine/threonine-protein kinase/formylglycine-generating enzyme family protein [Myxococcaceae bacterium]
MTESVSLGLCPVCATQPLPGAVMCAACGEILLTPEQDPMIGQQVGTWRVVKRLGVGGMGVVYEALEVNIERRAALKVVHPFLKDDEQLASLLGEARAVNAIGDEGIVDVFGFGKLPDGRAYLVMELLEGESLQARLEREKKLSVPVALDLLIALSRALEAAHASGFVHRDLKSANVFIVSRANRAPFPKLLDFGIVHRVKSGGGEALGTPTYAAPEQVTHTNVGPKADLYALGVLAFEMIAGKLPFDAPDGSELIRLHREAPRPHVNDVTPVPAALDELIVAMMATEPSHRPASAGEIRARLVKVKEALEAPAPPVAANSQVDLAPVAPRSNLGLIFGVSIAGLAVALLASWYFRTPTPTQPDAPPVDPVAEEVARTAKALDDALGAGVGASSVDALLAAEKSFPNRAEWTARRGRVSTALRSEAGAELGKGDFDAAEKTLAQLARLGPLPDDDALVTGTRRAAFASRNGMVKVGEVWVDKYEYPNRAGTAPVTQVDWADAVKLCEGVGKHLCTEAEWEVACKGAQGSAFPYGASFDKARCATKDKKVKRPLNAGARANCKTAEGVFDLSGNVAEWTASELREGQPQRVVRGGSFKQTGDQVSCSARDYLLPGIGGAAHLGLRCCL